MTVRERVLVSRLVQKIDYNSSYSKQIGLSYEVSTAGTQDNHSKPIQKREKE